MNVIFLAPEALLLVLGVAIGALRFFGVGRTAEITFAGLAAVAGLEAFLPRRSGFYGQGAYLWDGQGFYLQEFLLVAAALAIVILLTGGEGRRRFLPLALIATSGLLLLVSVNDFVLLLAGWALAFFPTCLWMAAESRAGRLEAALKYFMIGSMGLAALALGVALVSGVTGSTRFDVVAGVIETGEPSPALTAGIILVLAGLGFFIAAAPFHLWAPDVQQGASTPVSAFLSIAAKGAGFGALLRVVDLPFSGVPVEGTVLSALSLLSVLSLAFGSLAGMPQRHVKRLLAYAGIFQTGLLLAAASANSRAGHQALFFSLAALLLGLFPILLAVALPRAEGRSAPETFPAFAGLARRAPLTAWAVTLALASLAGLPPLPGFFARFLILSAAWQNAQYGLAAAIVFFSLPVLYYCLALIRTIFGEEPIEEMAPHLPLSLTARGVLWAGVAATLYLGFYPGPFLAWLDRLI